MHASGFEFTHRLDVAHASPDEAKLLAAYFDAKSSHDPKGTADYYRKPATAHVDVPLAGHSTDGTASIRCSRPICRSGPARHFPRRPEL
jgi:hypothetical protein